MGMEEFQLHQMTVELQKLNMNLMQLIKLKEKEIQILQEGQKGVSVSPVNPN